MGEVSKGDIDRVHQRIDQTHKLISETNKGVTDLAVNVTKLATIIERMPAQPPLPPRPCKDFSDHIADHKASQRDWRIMIIGLIGKAAAFIAVGLISYFIGAAKTAAAVHAAVQAAGH